MTESIKIKDRTFEVRKLTLEEGMPLMMKQGEMDMASIVYACVTEGGKPLEPGSLSMGEGAKLMPVVLRVNDMETGDPSGN